MTIPQHGCANLDASAHIAAIEAHLDALGVMDPRELGLTQSADDGVGRAQRLLGLRRRVEAVVARGLDAYATSGEWVENGARTPAAWLTGTTTESVEVVKGLIASGGFARTQPLLEEAALSGRVSQAHVNVWRGVRAKYSRISMLLDAAAEHIVVWAQELTPRGFKSALVELAHRLDPDLVDDIEEKKRRHVFLDAATTVDGYVHVSGLLDPATGALLIQALESARRAGAKADEPVSDEADSRTAVDADGDPAQAGRTVSQRNVEAMRRLLDAAVSVAGPDGLPSVAGARPRVTVQIDADSLMSDQDGPGMGLLGRFGVPVATLTSAQTRALACDATLAPVIIDRAGQITTVLPASRMIAPALRTAILARDEHCRFTGCRARIDEIHHIVFFSQGGQTTRSNLVGLCYFHHQLIHTAGWRITGDPDGELTFSHPSRHTAEPTAPRTSPAGIALRRRRQQAAQKARHLLADPHLNPPRRYALLARERKQPPEPPF